MVAPVIEEEVPVPEEKTEEEKIEETPEEVKEQV